MFIRWKGQVCMYFVRYYNRFVFIANVGNNLKLFFGPYSSSGVMRITKNEKLTIFDRFSKMVHIHFVLPVFKYQRIADGSTVILFDYPFKRVVYRWLYQNFIPGLCQTLYGESDTRDDTRTKADPFC